jgi:hypothetical protein
MYGTTYIVRPRMAPFKIARTLYFAPPGSIQLLVGPTSSFSGMQMKVRCSARESQKDVEARQANTATSRV